MGDSLRARLRDAAEAVVAGSVQGEALEADRELHVSLLLRSAAGAFGPALQEDVQLIAQFAAQSGLQVARVDLRLRIVRLRGSVAALGHGFGVRLMRFRRGTVSFFANDRAPTVPAALHGLIHGVLGLDDYPYFNPHVRADAGFTGDASSDGGQPVASGFTPPQIAAFYAFPAGLNGAGQSIGIVELGGGFDAASMQQYFVNDLKLPMPQITPVSVDAPVGPLSSPPSAADLEVCLDVQVIGAVANGAAIKVYFGQSTTESFLTTASKAVQDGNSVVSISWGALETQLPGSFLTAMNQLFQVAATAGVTVCASSGDNGSCGTKPSSHPNGPFGAEFPATSPFVLACGGTKITVADGAISQEVVWNDSASGSHGATGGGVSATFPVPDYQASLPPLRALAADPAGGWSACGGVGRMVPDVAGNASQASGYVIRVGSNLSTIGGTSAVAPLWAALVALLNQGTKRNLGFINPKLYAAAEVFTNVGAGSNAMAGAGCTSYTAQPGYDACTGLGSPNGAKLLALFGG